MRLWQIAALLILGVAVGMAFPGRLTEFFTPATLYVFLPALIFEGAWHLDLRVMRRTWRPIVLLAVPGVVVTAGIIAVAMRYLGAFDWVAALLLGAVLSATDPVAVIAIFRHLDVPRALSTIVESESLFNDAIAIVLYRGVLAAMVFSSGAAGVSDAVLNAIEGVAIGVLVGLAFAFIAAFALRKHVNSVVQSAATLAGAYGVYFIDDYFKWSGIFGVLAFGIALRELERRRISISSAEGVAVFWHRLCTLANLVLFFLIGAALDFTRLAHSLPAVGVTIVAVFAARAILAYGLLRLVHTEIAGAWRAVVRMAGIRGALSLALALATPAVVAQREGIIDATFAVVVVTVLLGSLTVERRLARLPLKDA